MLDEEKDFTIESLFGCTGQYGQGSMWVCKQCLFEENQAGHSGAHPDGESYGVSVRMWSPVGVKVVSKSVLLRPIECRRVAVSCLSWRSLRLTTKSRSRSAIVLSRSRRARRGLRGARRRRRVNVMRIGGNVCGRQLDLRAVARVSRRVRSSNVVSAGNAVFSDKTVWLDDASSSTKPSDWAERWREMCLASALVDVDNPVEVVSSNVSGRLVAVEIEDLKIEENSVVLVLQ